MVAPPLPDGFQAFSFSFLSCRCYSFMAHSLENAINNDRARSNNQNTRIARHSWYWLHATRTLVHCNGKITRKKYNRTKLQSAWHSRFTANEAVRTLSEPRMAQRIRRKESGGNNLAERTANFSLTLPLSLSARRAPPRVPRRDNTNLSF